MSPNDLFPIVRDLGAAETDPQNVLSAVRQIDNGDVPVEELFKALRASSVTRYAQASLGSLALGSAARELLDMLKKHVDEDTAWREQMIGQMRPVVAKIAEHDGKIIKGLANQPFYAAPESRHVGDIDTHFPTFDSTIGFVRWLRSEGWEWDTLELPWIKWHDCGKLYGQLSLLLPGNDESPARVDLHFGPFSIGHAELMPLVGWRAGSALGVPVAVPSAEEAIALTAAHALNDQMISMKDVNDLHFLLTEGIDWPAITELCRSVGAEAVLGQYLVELARAYPQDSIPSLPGVASLGWDTPPRLPRARAFAAHAYRMAICRGRNRVAAIRLAADAYHYYTADLSPRSSSGQVTIPVDGLRQRHRCWRLLPREVWEKFPSSSSSAAGRIRQERLADDLTLLTSEGAAIVRFGSDIFIATVWGDAHPKSVGLAMSQVSGNSR